MCVIGEDCYLDGVLGGERVLVQFEEEGGARHDEGHVEPSHP